MNSLIGISGNNDRAVPRETSGMLPQPRSDGVGAVAVAVGEDGTVVGVRVGLDGVALGVLVGFTGMAVGVGVTPPLE